MSRLVALLRRELVGLHFIWVAAFALGLIACSSPWFPGLGHLDASELRASTATGLALLWSAAFAAILGMNFLVGDLRERRLAFDFRMPVSSGIVWLAKAIAALTCILGGALLILLPSALARADFSGALGSLRELGRTSTGFEVSTPLPAIGVAILATLFLFNWIGLATTSRSGWAALDLVALVATFLASSAAVSILWRHFANGTALLAGAVGISGMTVTLAFASLRQVTRGRTEPKPAHRAFSVAMAVGALLTLATLAALSFSALNPSLRSFKQRTTNLETDPPWAIPFEAQSISADLIAISNGWGNAYRPAAAFLVNPRTAISRLVSRSPMLPGTIVSSDATGEQLAWIEATQTRASRVELRLWMATAASGGRDAAATALSWSTGLESYRPWALSPDALHVATVLREMDGSNPVRRLVVEEISTGSTVASSRIPYCQDSVQLLFLTAQRIRVGCGRDYTGDCLQSSSTIDFDLADLDWTPIDEQVYFGVPLDRTWAGSMDRLFEPAKYRIRADRPALLGTIRFDDGRAVELLDPMQSDTPDKLDHIVSSLLLRDGTLALMVSSRTESALLVFDSSSGTMRRFPLASGLSGDLVIAAASPDGRTLYYYTSAISRVSFHPKDGKSLVQISLEDGARQELARDIYPVHPDSAAKPTTLFVDRARNLLWLDTSKGTLTNLYDRL